MPSFDIICRADAVEIKNALDQANKEVGSRFDFKGSSAKLELVEPHVVLLLADNDFQLEQLQDVMRSRMARRQVDLRFLKPGTVEKMGGERRQLRIVIQNGIPSEHAKQIVRVIKETKLKVQASIQGDVVRVSGAKRDDLQTAMAAVRTANTPRQHEDGELKELPLHFENFRD